MPTPPITSATIKLTAAELAALEAVEWYRTHPPRIPRVTTIDFDVDTNNNPIADGTKLDVVQPYASWGVTFSADLGGPPGHVFARKDLGAETPPNVVSVNDVNLTAHYNASVGAVRATFSTPQRWVSIDTLPQTAVEALGCTYNQPYIAAFDVNGNYLPNSEVVYPIPYCDASGNRNPAWGASWYSLQIAERPTADIGSVEFSVQVTQQGFSVFALFDHLRFSA